MWIPLALIAVTTLQAGPVRVVRYGDERFEGITRVDIVVNASGEARSCGVVKDDLQSSATAALAESQITASVSEKAQQLVLLRGDQHRIGPPGRAVRHVSVDRTGRAGAE